MSETQHTITIDEWYKIHKQSLWQRFTKWIKDHRLFRIRIEVLRAYTDDHDTYVAFSGQDADKAYEEFVGDPRDQADSDPWEGISLFGKLNVYSEDKLRHYPLFAKVKKNEYGGINISAPAWAWVFDNGRGFLCSTEY